MSHINSEYTCPLCRQLSTVPHIKVYGCCASCKQEKMRQNLVEYKADVTDAEKIRQKAIEDAEIKYLMEIKAQEDRLLLKREIERKEQEDRLKKLEIKAQEDRLKEMERKAQEDRLLLKREMEQKEERLREEELKLREQNLLSLLSNINSTISDSDRKPMSSIPDFSFQLASYGYRLMVKNSSSRLGDCFNGLGGVPPDIINKHKNLTDSDSSYDNRYTLYEDGNKKYIIGCHRCLELWQHKCSVVVYVN